MRFTVGQGGPLTALRVDALVLFAVEDADLSAEVLQVDAHIQGAFGEARARRAFRGAVGEVLSFPTLGRLPASRLLVAGLGPRGQVTGEVVRRAAAAVYQALDRARVREAAVLLPDAVGLAAAPTVRAVVEGMVLCSYRFDRYRSEALPAPALETVLLLASSDGALDRAVQTGQAMAEGANYARDLANEPPNVLTPAELAQRAEDLAKERGMEATVLEPAELERRGMDALLAVGRGSAHSPRLIEVRYHGARSDPGAPTLGLVGKGITFDTGGISLKPGADMHLMKTDMGGAAAMLGAMHIIAALQPPLNVTMLVASAENMPDGDAYRPGDILRAKNGKTIEVQNTDAEGRLALADALCYAVELGLSPIIDAATLTGACAVALGPYYSGCFCNDIATRTALLASAETAGERLWPLPLDADYRPLLDSACADMRNIGGREGGAIIAATFLQEFVSGRPWAHLDIAPTAFADTDFAYFAKGLATGHPARALAQFALDLAAR
jgi:leucyl aminopeptidase